MSILGLHWMLSMGSKKNKAKQSICSQTSCQYFNSFTEKYTAHVRREIHVFICSKYSSSITNTLCLVIHAENTSIQNRIRLK